MGLEASGGAGSLGETGGGQGSGDWHVVRHQLESESWIPDLRSDRVAYKEKRLLLLHLGFERAPTSYRYRCRRSLDADSSGQQRCEIS